MTNRDISWLIVLVFAVLIVSAFSLKAVEQEVDALKAVEREVDAMRLEIKEAREAVSVMEQQGH